MASEIEPAERIEFEVFSRVCDLHPELVERFIVLGLLETVSDDEGPLTDAVEVFLKKQPHLTVRRHGDTLVASTLVTTPSPSATRRCPTTTASWPSSTGPPAPRRPSSTCSSAASSTLFHGSLPAEPAISMPEKRSTRLPLWSMMSQT